MKLIKVISLGAYWGLPHWLLYVAIATLFVGLYIMYKGWKLR